jgi:hypothetical protein|tara:strand:+ start:10699 stop:11298 length:600 start_codon:yes stop_codon:yes gene_type:complete
VTKQNIHIIDYKEFYEILSEIKENFSFQIFHYKNVDIFLENFDLVKFNNTLPVILTKLPCKKILNSNQIEDEKMMFFSNSPIQINKLIEKINIKLIKQKYRQQSDIVLKNYSINLNSKIISKNEISLKLTEKEINIILFLNDKKQSQKTDSLQNEVWGYSSKLETHTVETHIYRLRKKIKETFDDENFIINHDGGYLIK